MEGSLQDASDLSTHSQGLAIENSNSVPPVVFVMGKAPASSSSHKLSPSATRGHPPTKLGTSPESKPSNSHITPPITRSKPRPYGNTRTERKFAAPIPSERPCACPLVIKLILSHRICASGISSNFILYVFNSWFSYKFSSHDLQRESAHSIYPKSSYRYTDYGYKSRWGKAPSPIAPFSFARQPSLKHGHCSLAVSKSPYF
jgi:hypothetical protein